MDKQVEVYLKFLLCGHSEVGKRSILWRYFEKTSPSERPWSFLAPFPGKFTTKTAVAVHAPIGEDVGGLSTFTEVDLFNNPQYNYTGETIIKRIPIGEEIVTLKFRCDLLHVYQSYSSYCPYSSYSSYCCSVLLPERHTGVVHDVDLDAYRGCSVCGMGCRDMHNSWIN